MELQYKIAKAWVKVLKGTVTEEDKRRAEICSKCEYAKHKKYLDWINDELEEVNGMTCAVCQCPLSALIRSDIKCKKGYWDEK